MLSAPYFTFVLKMDPPNPDTFGQTVQLNGDGDEFDFTNLIPTGNDYLDNVLKQRKINKLNVETGYICEDQESRQNYTLMQFAAKNGMNNVINVLLKENVNPNIAGSSTSEMSSQREGRRLSDYVKLPRLIRRQKSQSNISPNCKKPPIFLAAENGHYETIALFKKYHICMH